MKKIKYLFALCLLESCVLAAFPLPPACAQPSPPEASAESGEPADGEDTVPLYEGLEGYGLCIAPSLRCPSEPMTAQDFQDVLAYMALHDLDALDLTYQNPPPEDFLSQVRRMSSHELYTYRYSRPEYFNYMNLVYFKEIQQAEDGSYILGIRLFAKDYDSETMTACRRQAFSDAQETLRSLYDAGELLPGMSERERALVITQWVVAHAEYDNDETRLCHTAWSVFRRGTAVCDGYVSALQLLLSLDGIRCRGQLGTVRGNETLHLWTIAVLDGVEVGIDPMGCEIDFRYFGMDWPKMEKWYVFRGEAA